MADLFEPLPQRPPVFVRSHPNTPNNLVTENDLEDFRIEREARARNVRNRDNERSDIQARRGRHFDNVLDDYIADSRSRRSAISNGGKKSRRHKTKISRRHKKYKRNTRKYKRHRKH